MSRARQPPVHGESPTNCSSSSSFMNFRTLIVHLAEIHIGLSQVAAASCCSAARTRGSSFLDHVHGALDEFHQAIQRPCNFSLIGWPAKASPAVFPDSAPSAPLAARGRFGKQNETICICQRVLPVESAELRQQAIRANSLLFLPAGQILYHRQRFLDVFHRKLSVLRNFLERRAEITVLIEVSDDRFGNPRTTSLQTVTRSFARPDVRSAPARRKEFVERWPLNGFCFRRSPDFRRHCPGIG